ncbi:MAG TPA: 4-hydroxy-tetrahydrodipicolinate synthase [Cytophagaceae bacterium]|jgi:4-hydroxy-tetrahydrodipicolinate synthase|nr:4-hydroxy-tetrahydrodipicolinate synthase [Cytophagaceae bacterium]
MNSKFSGTGVALVTPMREDGSIDYEGLKNLLSYTSEFVNYFVVNGTTAESATTSQQEKEEILTFVIRENKKKLPIVYGIGGNNTAELIQKIRSTDLKGVDALLSVSPYYNKPSQEGIFQHYKALAAASPVPVIIYNVPGRTGSNVSAQTTVRLSAEKNIIGIKEASGDLAQALHILKYARKDFLLISGDDLLTVPLISMGARGVISVIANAYPQKFSCMVSEALSGDFVKASESLKAFSDINPLLYEESNPVGIKEALEIRKICKNNVRLPLVKASEGLKQRIEKINKEI